MTSKPRATSQQIADTINRAHGWVEGVTNSNVTAKHVRRVIKKPSNHPIDVEILTEHRLLTKPKSKLQ